MREHWGVAAPCPPCRRHWSEVLYSFVTSYFVSKCQLTLRLSFRKDIDIRWHMAASNLSWFNSALNPIIYAILNLNFRKEYIRLMMLLIAKIKVILHIESKDKSKQKTNPSPGVSSFPLKLGVNKVDKNVKV